MNRHTADTTPSPVLLGNPTETFEWRENEEPSTTVVRAVADVTGSGTLDLPPLYHTISADAIDTLAPAGDRSPDSTVSLSFEYAGVFVQLTGESGIEIYATD